MADLTIRQNDTWPPLRGLATEEPLDITGSDMTADTLTVDGHGYLANDMVVLAGVAGGDPLVNGNLYYVSAPTLNTFKLSLTSGGAAIDLTSDITGGTVARLLDFSTAAGGVQVKLIGSVTITGAVTPISPPIEDGGQLFNWKYTWVVGDTVTIGDYIPRLIAKWDVGGTKIETIPNVAAGQPTVHIIA